MSLTKQFLPISMLHDILNFAPRKIGLALLLMVANSTTSGIGILLIIPLLSSLGMLGEHATDSTNIFSEHILQLTEYLDVPLSLGLVTGFYLLVILLVTLLNYSSSMITASLQRNYVTAKRSELFKALVHAKWQFVSTARSTDFVRLLTSQVQTIGYSAQQFISLISQIITLSVYLLLSIAISPLLSALAVFFALILFAALLPLNRHIQLSGRTELRANSAIFNDVIEQTSNLKIIKSFSAEPRFIETMDRASELLESQQVRMTKYTAMVQAINLCASALIFATLFYIGIKFTGMQLASLILVLFIFSRLMPKLTAIQGIVQRLIHSAPDYIDFTAHLQQLTDHAEHLDHQGISPSLTEKIDVRGLRYQYPTRNKPVFDDLSFSIHQNQTVAFFGESGSGKSTLVDMIAGLLSPDSGDILIDGIKLDDTNRLSWRRKVAYVTQDSFLFHDSLRANLSWASPEIVTDEQIWSALESAALDDYVRQLPEQLDTSIGDRGTMLSGGERQRLSLARALLCQPQILILDEPTSSLDSDNQKKICTALANLKGQLCILMVTHDEQMLSIADQRIQL